MPLSSSPPCMAPLNSVGRENFVVMNWCRLKLAWTAGPWFLCLVLMRMWRCWLLDTSSSADHPKPFLILMSQAVRSQPSDTGIISLPSSGEALLASLVLWVYLITLQKLHKWRCPSQQLCHWWHQGWWFGPCSLANCMCDQDTPWQWWSCASRHSEDSLWCLHPSCV